MRETQQNLGFLEEVAQDLYSKYGAEVGELRVLLPSRRARLFFTDALAQLAEEPIWEPEWISIDETMSRIAGTQHGERIRLIAELFQIYKRYHKNESFDRFYHWGEILLGDFDMVDKYMLDADQLFGNITDQKELETDTSYLTDEQRRIIAYWSSLDEGADISEHKRHFLKVWRSLLPIYKEFRARLSELGIAYSGMIYRIAAEKIMSHEYTIDDSRPYVVAGFNALSECERVLFDALKSSTQCHFYWDFDNYYGAKSRQEAGLFLEGNRLRYPAAAEISHDNFKEPKRVEAVACSSISLQCKYVAEVLESIIKGGGTIDKHTAIVLTDESLLLPLLYALPKYVGKVNVTMGYPLRQSLAYSFVERLLELQHHAKANNTFYHADVVGLLAHPYLEAGVDRDLLRRAELMIERERLISVPAERLCEGGSDLLREIFTPHKSWSERSKYLTHVIDRVAALSHGGGEEAEQRVEFLSFLSEQITALHNSILQCEIELSMSIYISLLRRHLQPLRIPFEGEPLEGLQVMGILETRNLDFDNVIMLSMNDDNFPGNRTQQPSFIPYNLRAAFELPTPEHHDGVYAYYFYRLIQRCKRLWMLYCSKADERSTGEQSRYITQLELESAFEVHRTDVGVDVNIFSSEAIEIPKEGRVAEQLMEFCVEHEVVGHDGQTRREIRRLSPTALFQYVACPLRFYFKSLARIRTEDEISEEVDAPMFGNILHDSMQTLLKGFEGLSGAKELLRGVTKEQISAAVEESIREKYFASKSSRESFTGNLMLVHEVVVNYIERGILRYDTREESAIDTILGTEITVEHFVDLDAGRRVRLHGICDRLDRMRDGSLRVVDYKTSAAHLDFAGVEALFTGEGKERQSNIFQTLLYSYMLRLKDSRDLRREHATPQQDVTPTLYYVRAMNRSDYSPLLLIKSSDRKIAPQTVESYTPLHEEFSQNLRAMLTELFDLSKPFRQCREEDVKHTCTYCDFQPICRRGNVM